MPPGLIDDLKAVIGIPLEVFHHLVTERVSPRVVRVVALPTPSDREKTQLYVQRHLKHFPAAG